MNCKVIVLVTVEVTDIYESDTRPLRDIMSQAGHEAQRMIYHSLNESKWHQAKKCRIVENKASAVITESLDTLPEEAKQP